MEKHRLQCGNLSTVVLAMVPVRLRHVLVMIMVGALIVSCSDDRRRDTVERDRVEVPAMDLSNEIHLQTKISLEQHVGIAKTRLVAELITDHVDSVFPYAKYRTYSDEFAEEEIRLMNSGDLPDAELTEARFENQVRLALSVADDLRTGDVAQHSGQMYDAYVAAVEDCAKDYGISNSGDIIRPSLEDLPSPLPDEHGEEYVAEVHELAAGLRRSAEGFDELAESLGFTRDELLDVRQSCSRYAAGLPLLDDDVREDLFRQLHEHYLREVSAWFASAAEAGRPVDTIDRP